MLAPCREAVGLHEIGSAGTRRRARTGRHAGLVQHQHLGMKQAREIAVGQRPHPGAARAWHDDHAV